MRRGVVLLGAEDQDRLETMVTTTCDPPRDTRSPGSQDGRARGWLPQGAIRLRPRDTAGQCHPRMGNVPVPSGPHSR